MGRKIRTLKKTDGSFMGGHWNLLLTCALWAWKGEAAAKPSTLLLVQATTTWYFLALVNSFPLQPRLAANSLCSQRLNCCSSWLRAQLCGLFVCLFLEGGLCSRSSCGWNSEPLLARWVLHRTSCSLADFMLGVFVEHVRTLCGHAPTCENAVWTPSLGVSVSVLEWQRG